MLTPLVILHPCFLPHASFQSTLNLPVAMQNLLDPLSRATLLWTNFFTPNTTSTMTSTITAISSHSLLTTSGLTAPSFSHSLGGKAECLSGLVSVPVISTVTEILSSGPTNNFELTEFLTNFARRDTDAFSTLIGASKEIKAAFDIYAKLCVPVNMRNATTFESVQFLTHGGTLDNSYWDFAPGYSYVDVAAEKGYATFSYDRLGSGRSEHPDPVQVVQVPLQVSLAHELIAKLKAGLIGGIAFEKVVGVGHSLGAAITQGVSGSYDGDFDAVILTGHSGFHGGSIIGFAAAAQQIANTLPDRGGLKGLANGYFSIGPVEQALQFAFYYYPHFDVESKPTASLSCHFLKIVLCILTAHSLPKEPGNTPNQRHRRNVDTRRCISANLVHQTRSHPEWSAGFLLLPG